MKTGSDNIKNRYYSRFFVLRTTYKAVKCLLLWLSMNYQSSIFIFGTAMAAQNYSGFPWNATCPSKCSCDVREYSENPLEGSLRTADCTNQKLLIIPPDIPITTQVLLLKGNAVSSIGEIVPLLTDLQHVDLSYNTLTSVGMLPIFQNLTLLRHMNLEGNRISTLRHGTFSGLQSLDELNLAKNQIELIEEHTFGGLNHLKHLDLSRNKIVQLKEDWFKNLPTLESLSLELNRLINIEDRAFKTLTKLERLSLAKNRLKVLEKEMFLGLDHLYNLDVSHNQLPTVPTSALLIFEDLKVFTMDGNPIRIVSNWDFQGLAITEISLSSMPDLIIIDSDAFLDLQQLQVLQLHDNKKLSYVDPKAFVDVPNLQMLYLHNNNLKALPYDIISSLQGLRTVSFHGNPMRCDCNVHWIRQWLGQALLMNDTSDKTNISTGASSANSSHITFQEADKFVCASPEEFSDILLQNIALSRLPISCRPTVVPFFNHSMEMELSTSVRYECRAIGVPKPHIHWILSNGKVVNNTSNYSRIKLNRQGTLSVESVKPLLDAGTYTCVATNSEGYDTVSTVLRIHNKDIHILGKGRSTNFITITWNGTQSTISTSDYVVLYKQKNKVMDYEKVHLRPFMRSYTIANLLPETEYEFCIAYQHGEKLNKLNCKYIMTRNKTYMMKGIKTIGNLTILVALCLTCSFVILICVLMVFIRRYRKRKAYSEPDGYIDPGLSPGTTGGAVNYKVGTMSQIPLDNLYNPPSTPLCSSQASLISQSNA